jgi:hypothetical protein
VLQFNLVYSIGSDLTAENRLFFRWSGTTPDVAAAISLATHVGTGWTTFWSPLVPDTTTLETVEATDLTSLTGAQGTAVIASPGVRGTPELGAATALLVSMTINRRYRGGKPRTYWSAGVQTDLATPQTWSSGFVAAAQTAANDFAAYVSAGASGGTAMGAQVNVSYYDGFLAVENPLTGRYRNVPVRRVTPTIDNITLWTPNQHLGSQRRRNQIR